MRKSSCYEGLDMTEADEWLRHLKSKGRKTNTLKTHRVNLRQCLNVLYANGRSTKAADITTDDIQLLWRELKVKESVRHSYIRSLSCMVEYYTRVDIVKQANILYNRPVYERVFISKDEFRMAYANADSRQRVILCLGAFMGLRRTEMAEIRDGDIDGDVMTVHGKGHGEEGFVVKMRIPVPVREAIREYRLSDMKQGESVDDYLLQNTGRRGELHGMSLNRISTQMTDLGRTCGFPITTHSLRRLYATVLYYDTGTDLQTVRNLMRHASASTTLKCYINAYEEKEREAGDRLTAVIGELIRNV